MNQVEFTFNWHYARQPRHRVLLLRAPARMRAPGNPSLPTLGTRPGTSGAATCRAGGTRRRSTRAAATSMNWNNKPARGLRRGRRRVVLRLGPARRAVQGLPAQDAASTSWSAMMNRGGTQDLRAVEVWPLIARVLRRGPAPDADGPGRRPAWSASGRGRGRAGSTATSTGRSTSRGLRCSTRRGRASPTAVLTPGAGPRRADRRASSAADPGPRQRGGANGSAYGGGWYGYVDKDLRSAAGAQGEGPYQPRYCGGGRPGRVPRVAVGGARSRRRTQLARRAGANAGGWRSHATAERIVFRPGLLGPAHTMRWTNRPTFQQVIDFRGHRRRP